jgi:hypothetical protein
VYYARGNGLTDLAGGGSNSTLPSPGRVLMGTGTTSGRPSHLGSLLIWNCSWLAVPRKPLHLAAMPPNILGRVGILQRDLVRRTDPPHYQDRVGGSGMGVTLTSGSRYLCHLCPPPSWAYRSPGSCFSDLRYSPGFRPRRI